MPKNIKRIIHERRLKTGESHQTAARHVRGQRPSLGFEAIVLRIIGLAMARNREDASSDEGPTDYLDAEPLLRPTPPAEAALLAALSELSSEDLRKLEVLMYSGREHHDVHTMERTLGYDRSDAITVDVVSGKSPLDKYLEEGLALAKRDGVDLDGKF